jgi:hypothetical protein
MPHSSLTLATAAVIALTAIAPAFACDPEDLKAEYRNLCATPVDAIGQMVDASAPRLSAEARAPLLAKAKEAKALCEADKYDDAMRLAVRVARALGSAEQAAGLPREQLTQVPAAGAATLLALK